MTTQILYVNLQILQEAECALNDDLQWALELSTHAFLADPANAKAKELRTQALLGLAAQQTSANGRNYLLTCLLEDHGVIPKRYPVVKYVLKMPLEIVFKRMAFSIKAEDVEDVRMTVAVKFKDLDRTFSLYIRNCVLEVGAIMSCFLFICIHSNIRMFPKKTVRNQPKSQVFRYQLRLQLLNNHPPRLQLASSLWK